MSDDFEYPTLESCVPRTANRSRAKVTLTVRPDDYDRMRQLSTRLGTKLVDTVTTLLNYAEQTEGEANG